MSSIHSLFNYFNYFAAKVKLVRNSANYRIFKEVNKDAKKYPLINCNQVAEVINFTSNDYLGMSTHPEVIKTMLAVTQELGVGSGGTRNISGSSKYHKELEETVAKLHKKQRGLIFNSAYLANLTAIAVLGKILPNLTIFSDELNHASIIDGILLSKAKKVIFRHNDVEHLKQLLEANQTDETKLIIFESIYSMHGTIGKIDEIIALAKTFNALTFIDEVHAMALYGETGAGVSEQQNNLNQIDFISGTFAKGYGTMGGYIVGSDAALDLIRSHGKGFIFTTSLPPALVAATIKSIEIVKTQKSLQKDFFANLEYLKIKLNETGINFLDNKSHIICIKIGNAQDCSRISEKLLKDYKIYLQSINYPTVKEGEEILRLTISPLHKIEQLDYLVAALSETL